MLKYIIFTEHDGGEGSAFCLAPMTHRELALAMQGHRHGRTIVSAGFVEWSNGSAVTSGHSDSLGIGPRPADARFLTTFAQATAQTARACSLQPATPAHHG